EQSIEQSLSTFSSHMTNIIAILKQVNEKTLVLFDELGAGTDPTEGAALALAILEYLMSKKCTTVATTHYSDIKLYASVTEDIENASCEFDVKTLSPTYKLLIGIPGKSNALYISRRLGLNQDIIENAKKFIASDSNDYEDVILSLEKSRQRIEKEEKKSIDKRKEIEAIEKNLSSELNKIDAEKQRILKKAEEKANDIIQEAKRKSEELLTQLSKLKKDGNLIINAKEEAAFKNMLNNTELSNEIKKPETTYENKVGELSEGDQVYVINLNKEGSVLKLPDNNNEVLVQIGIMKINVPLSNVKLIKNNKKVALNSYHLTKNKDIKFELDIRGMNLIDADIEIEKYLDDCYMSGLTEVQIIHGKGTGALRKGVQEILKRNPHTLSYRIGKYGEGETGVTVVTLKNS
ncbi:MAG: Smr/MutS family protein, partial [Clostridia bacterium]|nr:Smr/MutS family protein [Clostridia bacterium]